MIEQCCTLPRSLFTLSPEGRQLEDASKKLQSLDKKQPEKISARNMFLGEKGSQGQTAGYGIGEDPFEQMQTCIPEGAQGFADLTVREKGQYL